MKNIKIRAELQNLARKEILEMVPADTIARIKQSDPNPEFKVYCVGHEGVANAQELSFGRKLAKAYHYVKSMVLRLGEKLQFGTPIFYNHIGANTSDGREQIGELVGKAVKMVGDKLSALAAIYIYPQYRSAPLDIASIEGDVEYYAKGQSSGDVIDVLKISGIALGNSKEASPAFPGATLLGVLQAFSKEAQFNHEGDKMTKEEILEAIKEGKFKITDIYSKEEILETEFAKADHKDAHEHSRRVEKQLGEEREKIVTLTRSLEEASGKIKTLNEQVSITQVGNLLTQAAPARKFSDKEKAFIEKNLAAFKSDKSGEELKTDFDRFLDKQLKEFEETAKLMGLDIKKEAKPAVGAPSADGTGGGEDLTDPKNNDFIP